MSTARPFAYNPGSPISGTIQVGDLAVGVPTDGFTSNPVFWNGPDEELGYVIAVPVSGNTQPTPLTDNRLYLSPTYKAVDISLSDSGQTATQVFSYIQSVLGQTPLNNNLMFSVQFNSTNPSVGVGSRYIGAGTTDMNYQGPFNGYPGTDTLSQGFSDDGKEYYNGNIMNSGLPTWTSGDIIDIVLFSNTNWWIRVNGGYWNNNSLADPSTNSGGLNLNVGGNGYPVLCPSIYGSMTIQNYPKYGVPSGYLFLGNVLASVKFLGTKNQINPFNDSTFINLVNQHFNQTFTGATEASTWLTDNGYWNSYQGLSPVLSLDAADYSGTGPWIDSVGGKSFTLTNSPTWSSSNGGYFNFIPASSQYAICSTSLPSMSTWTVGVWHYYTGTETGGAPCIVTETFVGGGINYSLGKNNGGFSSGFFNGGWRVTDGYSLTPNNWYYIVGTYDGTTIKLYVNDTLVDSTNYTGTPTSSGAGIRLMERWDLADYWGGRLAIVDIYDVALSQSEITSKWSATKTRFGFAGPLTIATNDSGGLNGWGSQALSVAYSPTLISTYPVGSTITFQDGSTATLTMYDPYVPNYIDIFWDTPKSGILFPITISY